MRTPITRQRSGKGFSYFQAGQLVTDKLLIKYIKSLVIPPAWNDVEISPNPGAKILARGRDAAGRIQAIYNPKFRAKQEKAKFSKVLEFAAALPKLRKQVESDITQKSFTKDKVVACAIKLMDELHFRVGNERYAKENQSYGVTTLRSKHVDVEGWTVVFDFTGKSGKHQHHEVTDRTLARIVQQLDETPGYELFRYEDENGSYQNISAEDVNEYIKRYMGDQYSAKDFRTWAATKYAVTLLAEMDLATSESKRKRAVSNCVRKVAERLGNTPAVARNSYIDPRVLEKYLNGHEYHDIKETIAGIRARKYASAEEICVLNILRATK